MFQIPKQPNEASETSETIEKKRNHPGTSQTHYLGKRANLIVIQS